MFIASQAYSQELTPLQIKVRKIFSEIRNRDNIAAVKEEATVKEDSEIAEAEKVIEDINNYSAQPEENTQIIIASEQEQDETEEYEEGEGEEEIVVATAPKAEYKSDAVEEKKEYSEVITASDASSEDRTAKIDNKWSIGILGWNSELDGHINIAENKAALVAAGNNGRIDLKNDTTLDKKKVPSLKLSYRHGGRSSFEFSWTKVEQDGQLIGIAKEFKGKLYQAGARFEINNSMYDLLWKYRFNHKFDENGREKSYVAGLLGIKSSKMDFSFNGQATVGGGPVAEYRESKSETIPVPYIGIEAGTYVSDKVYLKGYYRYLKLNNIKDYDAEHSDYDVSLSYKLSEDNGNQDVYLDVGYRQVVYDVEGKGNDVELKYKGPYIGLEFRF